MNINKLFIFIIFTTGISCNSLITLKNNSSNKTFMQPTTINALQQKFKTHNLSEYWAGFSNHIRRGISMEIKPQNEVGFAIGQSKLGGQPDLPQNASWFTDRMGNSLSFIAQINLSELTKIEQTELLPKKGILYFFYDLNSESFGLEITDKDKFKVFFYDGDVKNLERKSFPKDICSRKRSLSYGNITTDNRLPTFTPKFVSTLSIPSASHSIVQNLIGFENTSNYWEILFDLDYKENQLLGFSNYKEYDMEFQCEAVTTNLNVDSIVNNEQQMKDVDKKAEEWLLLLQIGRDDDEKNENWNINGGNLYFWIKKEDLKKKNFDNCWIGVTTK